ncbi:MAG: hypothetical protein ABIQ31_21895 [Ferruginibacter sp.]
MIRVFIIAFFFLINNLVDAQVTFYVSPKGNYDKGPGSTFFYSLDAALLNALAQENKDVTIVMRAGTYYPDSTIVINAAGYKLKSLHITAYKEEKVIISGAMPVKKKWNLPGFN